MTASHRAPTQAEISPQRSFPLTADISDCLPPSRDPSPSRSCSIPRGSSTAHAPLIAVHVFTGAPRIRGRFQRRPYFEGEIRIGCDCMACETQSGDCAMYMDDYYATLTERNSMFVAAARGVSGGVVLWKGGRVVENVCGVGMLGGVPVVRGVGAGEKFVGKVRVGCDCVGCRKGWGDCVMYYYDEEAKLQGTEEKGGESEKEERDEEESLSHGAEVALCESMARLRLEEEVHGEATVDEGEAGWHKHDFVFSGRKLVVGAREAEVVEDMCMGKTGETCRNGENAEVRDCGAVVSIDKAGSRTEGMGRQRGEDGRGVTNGGRLLKLERGGEVGVGWLKEGDGDTTVVRRVETMTRCR